MSTAWFRDDDGKRKYLRTCADCGRTEVKYYTMAKRVNKYCRHCWGSIVGSRNKTRA